MIGWRVLDPVSRISEILFGLIMALTFTGTLGAAAAGREEVRTLLFGALGCNIAWGLVDGVMFLMGSMIERGRERITIRDVQGAATDQEGRAVIARTVSPALRAILNDADFERLRLGVSGIHGERPAPSLTKADWLGAACVFLLVFVSTLPVVIPFLLFRRVHLAVRVSNLVAIVMLFACGYWVADYSGHHPWQAGLSMVVLGTALVAVAIAFGG